MGRFVFRLAAVISLIASVAVSQSSITFACVGDYGREAAVQSVANFIASKNPDFIVTVGDNNYTPNNTTVQSWDDEVGRYYGQFIRYPAGSTSSFAPGPAVNKFFPALGNHDWDANIAGWYNYFELPNNERYFDVVKGPVHLFFIDSDARETDGNTSASTQGQWLQSRLGASVSPWRIVLFHHPSYSSSSVHGNTPALQWPFATWGASIVLTGHDHTYERIVKSGFNYIVNGIGGRPLYAFRSTPEPGSIVRYNANYGAVFVTANDSMLTLRAFTIGNVLIDSLTLSRTPTTSAEPTSPALFHLEQNFPNPFNPATTIGFTLIERSVVELKLLDELGNDVATLVNDERSTGRHEIQFSTQHLASGVYFYRLTARGHSETKRLMLLK